MILRISYHKSRRNQGKFTPSAENSHKNVILLNFERQSGPVLAITLKPSKKIDFSTGLSGIVRRCAGSVLQSIWSVPHRTAPVFSIGKPYNRAYADKRKMAACAYFNIGYRPAQRTFAGKYAFFE